MFEKIFKLKENRTTVKTEIVAGITTFMTMAYILAVNPNILSAAGMDGGAVFVATAISAAAATLVMAFVANLPFALAPGMGLNAFFAFTVVLAMGHPWQFALTAVFIEGLIFILLTAFNVRELIIDSIPAGMKKAISVGIGLFIAFIGLKSAGIVASNEATFVTLGNVKSATAAVAIAGILITAILLAFRVKGAILIGLLISTIVGIPLGVTQIPHQFSFSVPSLSPIFLKFDWEWIHSSSGIISMIVVVFTFLFVDMFDTIGTLIGVTTKANMLTEDGKIPRAKQALFADAIGTAFGAMLGTSTVTTYVESASGVAEGGRTGLTALTTGVLFLVAILLAPVFLMIPGAATAPALVIVGVMMVSPVKDINFDDFTEAVPAFLTFIMMPLTYSIADGIFFGIVSYVLLKVFTGKWKDISIATIVLGTIFLLNFILK